MRSLVQADLKGLRLMWIRGWRFAVFVSWVEAVRNHSIKEWWEERPWQ